MKVLILILALLCAAAFGEGERVSPFWLSKLPDGLERVFVCDLFRTHPQSGEELTLRVVIPAEGDRAEWSDGTETGEMFFSGFSGSIMLQELVGYDTLDTLLIGSGDGQTWARYRRGVNRTEMKIDSIWVGECLRQIN